MSKWADRPAFAVYDMEWSPDLQVQFIGYYDGKEFRGFTDLDEFCDFIMEAPARVMYAHSGGSYDVLFLLGKLIQRGAPMRGFFSGVALAGLTVSTSHGQVTLADSLFLIQSSVAKLGAWVGLEKGDLDHTVVHKPEVYAPYCFRDCEIVYRAIDRFRLAVADLGVTMKLTVGATAIALAKHYGGVFPLLGPADRQLTPAYFGGRTEDIVRGTHKNINYYDINSAYPWAMTQEIPGKFLGSTRKEPKGPYFVRCRNIRLSGRHGPIPVRTPGGLYYPVGVIPEAILSKPEAELADDYDPIAYYSFAPNRGLAGLVEKLYALRLEGGASALVYKILANSVYGKFAEKSDKDALLVHPDEPRDDATMVMPGVYRFTHWVRVAHRNVATAAYITALVRCLLHSYMDDTTVYVDTDGFWTPTDRDHECSTRLGGIKLENRAKRLDILQPKVYRADDMVKAKGYRNLTSDQFDDLARGEKVHLEPVMHRAKGMIRRGMYEPVMHSVSKGMHTHNRKRRPDGSSWDYQEVLQMIRDANG